MINNDVLRSVRFTLNVDDAALAAIIGLGEGDVSAAQVSAFLRRDDDPAYVLCSDQVMASFLDGLIVHRRGRDETAPQRRPETTIMHGAGFKVSRPELSALFRSPTHPNHRACGDQFLRCFLKSLTNQVRASS